MNIQVEKMKTIDLGTLTEIRHKIENYFGQSLAQQCFDLISSAVKDKIETDWNISRICLVGGKQSFHVVSDTGINNWNINIDDGIVEIEKSILRNYRDVFVSVEVINKRVIGRLIVQYIGNEGADLDDRKIGLRKLFQATIDYIQTHAFPNIWENAKVTVYDSEDNSFKVLSGNGKNAILVNENNGNPKIIYTVNNQVRELEETVGIFSQLISCIWFKHSQ